MDSIVATAVSKLIEVALLAVVSVFAFYAKGLVASGVEYLKAKVGATQFSHLKDFAQMTVRSIEQSPVYQDLDSAKKKELAVSNVVQWASKMGLPVTNDLIDKVLEEAVQIMNTELGPIITSETVTPIQPAP